MQVAGLDLRNEFVERVFCANGLQKEMAFLRKAERHFVAFRKAGFTGDRQGNADGKAIAPFGDIQGVWHWDLH